MYVFLIPFTYAIYFVTVVLSCLFISRMIRWILNKNLKRKMSVIFGWDTRFSLDTWREQLSGKTALGRAAEAIFIINKSKVVTRVFKFNSLKTGIELVLPITTSWQEH